MTTSQKQSRSTKHIIRVMFDVMDPAKTCLRTDEDLSVAAPDPDEAIEYVYTEMKRQFKRSDILLARVRICA
ncbi:hypothetical protein G8759_14720 [Spirosoma aureum]|uniref:Uncharacterized protein n=1 Tax=Spirosoma aureum TaxID=2692134 RepID=A0A6G9AFD0_9BACT|nr:hypothetical protein [Spirosoma aureum]QIP11138.1 hypothetical protein G8759_14720 [Spirosoma aureum]